MSGLLNKLTSSIYAVWGAITPVEEVQLQPQLSSKRPPNKKGGSAKPKPKRRPRPAQKIVSTGEVDQAATLVTTEEEPSVGTDDEVARPVNEGMRSEDASEDETTCKAADESREEEERRKEELRKERNRKKAQKQKEKAAARKLALQNSIVREMPVDPLQAERLTRLADLEAEYNQVPLIVTEEGVRSDYQTVFRESQAMLDTILRKIEELQRDMIRRTPRSEIKNTTPQQLRQLIQNIELSPDKDPAQLTRRVEELATLISMENNREFLTKLSNFQTTVEQRKKLNVRAEQTARDTETRERILQRIRAIKTAAAATAAAAIQSSSGTETPVDRSKAPAKGKAADDKAVGKTEEPSGFDPESIGTSDLYFQQFELSSQAQLVLYVPYQLVRRIERRYHVVIETARQTGGQSERRGGSRTVNVWGLPNDVKQAIKFLSTANFSNQANRKTYDKRLMGAIIGRAGAGLAALEAASDCFVLVDGDSDVVVIGKNENAKTVFDKIDELKIEGGGIADIGVQATGDVPLDPTLARALVSLHRARIQGLERELNARITVLTNPTDGSHSRILVRTKKTDLPAALKKVQEDLVGSFHHLTFPAPARAISRLLYPPRSASETSAARLLNEEFKAARTALGIMVERIGDRDSDDSESALSVVCHKVDLEAVNSKLPDLIKRASYITVRLPIDRQQLRIFTPDNRALIEASSQCRVSVATNDEGVTINLTGSEEACENGRKVVTEILERDGAFLDYNFADPDTINLLLRDRGATIRSLENQYDVSIKIFRNENRARVVGEVNAIEATKEAIDQMESEIVKRKQNIETLHITLEANRVPQIIGRGGATINDIRSLSGVDSINIPNREDADADGNVTITVIGQREAVADAQKQIERILTRDQPSPLADDGEPSGRARDSGRRGGRRGPVRPPAPPPQTVGSTELNDDNFPSMDRLMGDLPPPRPSVYATQQAAASVRAALQEESQPAEPEGGLGPFEVPDTVEEPGVDEALIA